MNTELKDYCESLEKEIVKSYEEGVTLEEAERLAGRFLHAQMTIAKHLHEKDLNARMRKAGLKAVRAAIYMEHATKGDKKPSDVMLGSMVDMNELVATEQQGFDEAESEADSLRNYLSIFKEAHVFFRTITRGGMQ